MNWQNYTDKLIDMSGNQTKLADIAGVTQATISYWKSGKTVPDVKSLARIKAKFGGLVDLDDMVSAAAKTAVDNEKI